jgi:hypothetical protein
MSAPVHLKRARMCCIACKTVTCVRSAIYEAVTTRMNLECNMLCLRRYRNLLFRRLARGLPQPLTWGRESACGSAGNPSALKEATSTVNLACDGELKPTDSFLWVVSVRSSEINTLQLLSGTRSIHSYACCQAVQGNSTKKNVAICRSRETYTQGT